MTPIVLFVYKRPECTRLTIESLLCNPEARDTALVVYSDAAKKPSDGAEVDRVRALIREAEGFASIRLIEWETNRGLSNSVITGVSAVLEEYGRAIVLEDDHIVSKHFLSYMNCALDMYEKDEEVVSIHGYSYPCRKTLPEIFFIKGADCWGWATWSRAWRIFEPDADALLRDLKRRKLEKEFDFNGSYGFSKMLRNQARGKIDSWAIRWYASAFLHDKLTLYPGRSLVRNVGFGENATHSEGSRHLDVPDPERVRIELKRLPIDEDLAARKAFEDFFNNQIPHPSLERRILGKFRRILLR